MLGMKFTNNLRVKITTAIILCCIITTLLVSGISIFINYKFFQKEITDKMLLLSQNYANSFNNDFNASKNITSTLRKYVNESFDVEEYKKNPEKYLQEYERSLNALMRIVAGNMNKKDGIQTESGIEAIYATLNPQLTGVVQEIWYANTEGDGSLKRIDSDPRGDYIEWFYEENEEMKWYYEPIKVKKGVWSDVYKEIDLNMDIVSYTEPIFKEDILVGVVGIDINIEAMKNTIRDMKIYDTGYAFIVNNEHDFLIHPTLNSNSNIRDMEKENLDKVAKELKSKDSGVVKYDFEGEKKILGYLKLSNDWIFAVTVPLAEVYASLRLQIILCVVVIIFSLCIGIIIAIYIGNAISKPVVEITRFIKDTASFNFDRDCNELLNNNKNELGVIVKEVQSMRKMLKETGMDRAAKLQVTSLQREFPLPDKVKMDILYAPAKIVSGDLYHLEKIHENLVVGIIWDVSGKGVTAALNTSAFNILFHEVTATSNEPDDVLYHLNNRLPEFLGETYIAACCFSFDFEKNLAKISGAGINQFMYSSKVESYEEKIVTGPFLGMFENQSFEQEVFQFEKGDKFYFLTDGLEDMFSNQKMRKQFTKIQDIKELTVFLQRHLSNEKAKYGSLMDDCTILAFEME